MGKKVREYKSGDFIFAKVKGYPAWPARVQRPNGKKYFVYFYGTGETANLPPNMIFDYAENKDKFLTKTVKRRDFNDGVKQIEYDFANNVPLEEVIGVPLEVRGDLSANNDTANDSALDTTVDESVADTTANDTVADDPNATQTDAVVEDSDDAGPLVIDEGKTPTKGRKIKTEPKAKETPKSSKTPRGKAKKEEPKEKDKEDDKIDEELVSRSGRKIRPKRYMDEQTEDNATLPSPAPKRRRGSPVGEKEKPDAPKEKEGKSEKNFTEYNVVKQSELEGLKKPFEPSAEDDKEKENILIAYLPRGQYAGIRVFAARPRNFKNEAARLHWDKQAARNALTLKMQLEKEHITPQSVAAQLVMDLNLTDEEKATLDKERETEEKKSRVSFLKTEMKLIELDAKIKTCLCLEKADTELCLKLLDDLLGLEVKPLMLLKHPTCLETVKRMRAYVGNTPSWDLSEQDALRFSKQAHNIRRKADALYKNMKEQFSPAPGLSFWEYFSERVLTFKKVTGALTAGELLELVHEPAELSNPNAHTMTTAIEEANNSEPTPDENQEEEDDKLNKKKAAVKPKKSTPAPTPSKPRKARNKKEDESTPEQDAHKPEENAEEAEKEGDGAEGETEKADGDAEEASKEPTKEEGNSPSEPNEDVEMAEPEKASLNEVTNETAEKETPDPPEESEASEASEKSEKGEKSKQSKADKTKESDKPTEKSSKKDKKLNNDKSESEKSVKDNESEKSAKDTEKKEKRNSKDEKNSNNSKGEKNDKDSEKSGKEKGEKSDEKTETEKSDDKDKDEPRAKRSRESKKTEPPPRSPAKRKSKF